MYTTTCGIVMIRLSFVYPLSCIILSLCAVSLKLLCGADLLESFAVPDLWATEDVSVLGSVRCVKCMRLCPYPCASILIKENVSVTRLRSCFSAGDLPLPSGV